MISESVIEGKKGKTETTMIEEKKEEAVVEEAMPKLEVTESTEITDGTDILGVSDKDLDIDEEIEKVMTKFEEEELETRKPAAKKKQFKEGGE